MRLCGSDEPGKANSRSTATVFAVSERFGTSTRWSACLDGYIEHKLLVNWFLEVSKNILSISRQDNAAPHRDDAVNPGF